MALTDNLNPEQHKHPFTSIGGAIKHYRLKNKFTQQQLATKLGTSQANISHYEREFSCPPLKVIQKLSRELGVPLQVLCSSRFRSL